MKIEIKNQLRIEAPRKVLVVIERNCTYRNPKYQEAVSMNRSTRNIPSQLCLGKRMDNALLIPTGLLPDILATYPEAEIIDQRSSRPATIPFKATLRPYQAEFVTKAYHGDGGVMVAATGAGKTVSAIALASWLKQRCLILVKSKDLAEQWRDAIRQFTGLEAGLIGGGRSDDGEQFTIALVQTLVKRNPSALDYGLVIADECHNAPASQFYQVITNLNARYKFGLSATPQRRDNPEFMIHAAFRPIVAEVKPEQLDGKVLPVTVYPLRLPFDAVVNDWNCFINALIDDDSRNQRIIQQVGKMKTKNVIILTAQVRHAEILTTIAIQACFSPLLINMDS